MQFKQKLAYIALGGLLVFMGQLLPNLIGETAMAQKSKEAVEFDTIRARRIEIVDEKGQTYALLEKQDVILEKQDTGEMSTIMVVFNHSGYPVCMLGTSVDGEGALSLGGTFLATPSGVLVKNNKGYASMMVADTGIVSVGRELDKPMAFMSFNANGGQLKIGEKTGTQIIAAMAASDNGGVITVGDKETKRSVTLAIVGDGGMLSVAGKDGGRVDIAVDKYGGRIGIFGKGGNKERAGIGVNEYGNGTIGLWDKNGYRIK